MANVWSQASDHQHRKARAVIDGCELIQALSCPGYPLNIQLQPMSELWLLLALPRTPCDASTSILA